MVYTLQNRVDTGSGKAIVISAATTLIGAFSLLAARTRRFFPSGSPEHRVCAGWLCSQIVIPSLYRLYAGDGSGPHHA